MFLFSKRGYISTGWTTLGSNCILTSHSLYFSTVRLLSAVYARAVNHPVFFPSPTYGSLVTVWTLHVIMTSATSAI